MTSVELTIDFLKRQGVEWMATLCGHGLDPFFRAAKAAGLRLVDTRNEQTAAYIAESHGRLTRKPGVCAVSSGIAHINALTGVANAWFDGAPMLLISGAAAHRTAGMGHFQDMDQVLTAAPITRYSRTLDHPQRTLQILAEAWSAASSGPVHLTYPMDIQNTEVVDPIAALPDSDRVLLGDSLSEDLARARRPLVIAGSGVWYSGHGANLVETCEKLRIPFVTPIWDRGVVVKPTRTYQGVIGAATGGARLLADADLVILAGARADYRVGYLQPGAIAADCVVRHVAGLQIDSEPSAFEDWLNEACRRRDEFRAGVGQRAREQAAAGLHASDIIDALKAVMTDDTSLVIDGGSIGQWAHQLMNDRYPPHWLTCGASGVVGYGIGGAMAARLAFPDQPVVLLSGDGAFTFNVAELECAVRQNLPFVAIVADDLGWGITRVGHIRQFGEPIASSLGPIAFDKLAESLGARGERAVTREQIEDALRRGIASREVTVIHVPIVGGNP